MGIDLVTWWARIGLNYYHMCRPLQTRWRSSGGQLYQPGVASWGVGEVMNDAPLVLKGCMTVVALSLILQCLVHFLSKLKRRGGGGKVHCRWHGSSSQVRGTVHGGGILLLRAIVVVIPLLLVIAGDVERNPGPGEPTLKALLIELHSVRTNWYNIGLELDIPYTELNCFRTMYPDPSDSLREVLIYWLKTAVDPHPTWEAVVSALKSLIVNEKKVAAQLESKYCTPPREESNSSIKVEKGEEVHDRTTDSSQFKGKIEGSQKLPFGCGCGKPCTFFSFIESGCPTPIPSASSFPYLDLSGLTHEQQEEVQGKLCFESKRIMVQFQELVSATVKSLTKRKISLKKLLFHVMTLGTFDPVFKEPQVPLFCYRFRELKAAKTILEIFLVLNDYLSFFNYQLIECIINELGTEKDKAMLQRYKDNFNQYAKRRIFECLPEFGPISDADHADIFVKLDPQYDNYTGAQIEQFRHKVSEVLHLSFQGILRLCRIDKGCFQLMFQVPSFVQQGIFPLSREQERALAVMGVMKLTCGEYQFLKGQFSQAGVDKRDDPDDESGIGPSISTDTESITFPEHEIVPHFSGEQKRALSVTCGKYQFLKNELSQAEYFRMVLNTFTDTRSTEDHQEDELDYELKVQGHIETVSSHQFQNDFELHHAAAIGQLENVRYLVEEKHCNSMQRDQSGFAAFHVAAIVGNVQVFRYFISECNCNPACPGPLGLTPLHLASQQGHLDIAKYLVIEQQIDPLTCEDEYKNTPLHRACVGGCQAVVEFLTSEHKIYNPITKLVRDLQNTWNSTPIHNATWNGHLDILKFFISDENCDSDLPGHYGATPLHYAAEGGHLHIVKYLTDEQGCNPSCLDSNRYTPLHLAAWKGHMDIVKFLTMEKHCDPMSRDPDHDQNTPLHIAATHGHIDIVKFLTLETHCDPTSRNAGNVTALHVSAIKGHLDVLRFFTIDQNCDPNLAGQYGQAPLHYAATFGHLHIVKYLIDEEGCNPSCLDDMRCTPLHCAAAKGHMDIVNLLIVEKHCDPMCRDSNLNTPLHMAALGGCIDIVKFLTLEIYCDPKSRNANRDTALHSAVKNGHLDIVQFLISDHNCDPTIPGQYGRTPLHYASEFGHLYIVKYLTVEQGCNPSCLDEYNYTPLHCAAVAGHMNIVKFLTLEKHCNPMCRDSTQSTLLHMAAAEGHREVVKFLTVEKHCDPMCEDLNLNTPLHMAAGNGHEDTVKFLTLEMHCDPTSRNTNNNTALHVAVINGHLGIIQFFISDQNCDPNLPGQYGGTLLHIAATCGHLHIVKYLTDEQGCNPSCLNEYKHTPLHCAAKEGHNGILKFLLVEKNCDPMSRNIYGNTAFHCAVLDGHFEVVKFLIEEVKCPPDIIGQHNATPFQMALYQKHADIAHYLQKHSVMPYIYIAMDMIKQLGFLK